MEHYIEAIVTFIGQHAEWTFPVMFVTAFGESFVFLSLLFPGTSIMIAAGLLVPGGTLHLVPLLSGAILGAVLGDSVSWWLGRRYGHLLDARWPFRWRPELLAQGREFFQRFGLASVFVGRFFGPLRATVPLLAGIAKMPPLPFWLSNIASAVIWAPALLLPGSAVALLVDRLQVSGFWKAVAGCVLLVLLAGAAWLVDRWWFAKTGPQE
ncbi:MAG: DedA family protein [Alphaproteobacteria bacterium]|nr:DedA family protein [Alphaproteobacteria bacterium]MDE2011986.1 DedA family protein [Alphaproteobacteria bacterium]MDE2074094.1 DedA family protein [Alphaproteobacteria bacterium]MDE2350358.1 DedA family protein [Alphaproteobacteria bacterium]